MSFKKSYYDPRSTASLGGRTRLVKSVGSASVNWLKSQDAYTLHKQPKRKFKRRKYIVSGIDDLWQADLADFSTLAESNEGFKYALVVIDVFSKYVWVKYVKNKTAEEVMAAFKMLLMSEERKPTNLMTDKGKEFDNSLLRQYLTENEINFYTAQNPQTKAAVAERVIRTLKNRLYRYFTYKQSWKYLNVLQNIVYSYNRTRHRSIGMAPVDVTKESEGKVRKQLYPVTYIDQPKFKFTVGESVRIAQEKPVFGKGYHQQWSEEIFKVLKQLDTHPPVYKLKDFGGEVIVGTFYEPELQSVIDTGIYKVSDIIETRLNNGVKEHLVRWKGYPESMNSWITNFEEENAN